MSQTSLSTGGEVAVHMNAEVEMGRHSSGLFARSLVIGLTAFLTVVDLFATQAILPSLARHYSVTPGAMGFAVNASTLGMAIAGLGVAYFSKQIDRRLGILIALVVLAIPTALLASAPNLPVFTILRVMQGLCMASAFTLTLAYLGEHTNPADTASAFAAYITGNVASNLVGRFISAAVADHLGLSTNFYFFALLNLAGAGLVYFTIHKTQPARCLDSTAGSHFAAWGMHLKNPQLRASFGIAFCILFAFIGTFTYVNFVLVRSPLMVGMMALGLVYLVFLPSIITTPLAGRAVALIGTRPTMWISLSLAAAGLPLLVMPSSSDRVDRHGAGWRWHILRAGNRNRVCRPRGNIRSRLRQRHLSRLLFLWRISWQRSSWPSLRSLWLARDYYRDQCLASHCGAAGVKVASLGITSSSVRPPVSRSPAPVRRPLDSSRAAQASRRI